jgi:hypothetical protein
MGNHVYVLDAATLQQSGPPINVVTTYGNAVNFGIVAVQCCLR